MAERVPLTASDTGYLTFASLPRGIGRSIVPLLEMSDTADVTPWGTAFVIGAIDTQQVLLVTAAHIIPERVLDRETELVVGFPRDDTAEGSKDIRGMRVTGISMAESASDVALLVVEIDDPNIRPARLSLTSRQPTIGTNCLGLGYPNMRIGESVELRAEALIHLSSSRGPIEEIHYSRRDNAMITFPSMRVAAKYSGGMSGGPVLGVDPALGTQSRVFGVVSSGMDLADRDVPETSYAALIVAILGLDLPIEEWKTVSVIDLAMQGHLDLEGPAVEVSRSEGQTTVIW